MSRLNCICSPILLSNQQRFQWNPIPQVSYWTHLKSWLWIGLDWNLFEMARESFWQKFDLYWDWGVISLGEQLLRYWIMWCESLMGIGYDRFCNAGLPSDITVIVDGMNFHLHKVMPAYSLVKLEWVQRVPLIRKRNTMEKENDKKFRERKENDFLVCRIWKEKKKL